MQSDRELVELAAKAVGYHVMNICPKGKWCEISESRLNADGEEMWWAPLEDDGDALRLAVDLNLTVHAFEIEGHASATDGGYHVAIESWGSNKAASTRRAIVRAAAAIGKEMK